MLPLFVLQTVTSTVTTTNVTILASPTGMTMPAAAPAQTTVVLTEVEVIENLSIRVIVKKSAPVVSFLEILYLKIMTKISWECYYVLGRI